jgi:hypothetical protein
MVLASVRMKKSKIIDVDIFSRENINATAKGWGKLWRVFIVLIKVEEQPTLEISIS